MMWKGTRLQSGQASLATSEGGSCTKKNMTSTGSCSYSFVYSWWVRWTPEMYRENLQNNK